MAEFTTQLEIPIQSGERNTFKQNFKNQTSSPGDPSLISKQEQSSLTHASLIKKNSCLVSPEKKEPAKNNSALKRFRKAAFGIQFTQALGRDLHSELNKEFVDLKNPNDCRIAVDLLQKTTKKTMREILFLKRAVEGLKFFQARKDNLTPKLYTILFDEFKVKLFKKQEIIYHYGDTATNFFIILKGSCCLLTPNDEQKLLNQSLEFTRLKAMYDASRNGISEESIKRNVKFGLTKSQMYNPSSPQMQQLIQNNKTSGCKEIAENPQYWDSFNNFLNFCFNGFQVTCEYLTGDSFGDFALTTRQKQYDKNQQAAGTVVVSEDSILLSLTKEGYEHILGEEQKQIIKNKMNFFRQFQFFKNFTDTGLISMLSSLRDINLKKGDVIFKEGDTVEYVYFIVNGEVELSQSCQILIDSKLQKVKTRNHSNYEITYSQEKDSDINVFEKLNHRLRNINSVKEEKLKHQCQLSVKFALLGNNSCFGEYEIVQENRQRHQQAECYSMNLQLYAIKKEILMNYLKTYECLQTLKDYALAAQKERDSRIAKAKLIQQRIVQSQFKEGQKIKQQQRSHSLNNNSSSINLILTPSVSVDNLDILVPLHLNDIQHEVVTSKMINDTTATLDSNNSNNPQISEPNDIKSLKYSLSKINRQADQTAMISLNNSYTTGSTVNRYSIVSQGLLHNRINNSSHQMNSYLDSAISDSIITSTKHDKRNSLITEFTRQKVLTNIKLIERKKKRIFSELKRIQNCSLQPGKYVLSELHQQDDHKKEILFDYLFQETPLLSKIKGYKSSNKLNKHYLSLQAGSFDRVSKENVKLMEVIHKSMRQDGNTQKEKFTDADVNIHQLDLTNKKLESRINIGSLSYINLLNPSNSNENLHSKSEHDTNKKSEFQIKNSIILDKPHKRNSISMTKLDQLMNHNNQQQQNSNITMNIHTQGLKAYKVNPKYHNNLETSMKSINFSCNNKMNIDIEQSNHNSIPSNEQYLPPLKMTSHKNYFEDITNSSKNRFSINKQRNFSLPNLSINSIPQNPLPQSQQNAQNLLNLARHRNSFDTLKISLHQQYSAFQPILSSKRTFSLNNILKNPVEKIHENLTSISKSTSNQGYQNNNSNSSRTQKNLIRILNNSSSSPIF